MEGKPVYFVQYTMASHFFSTMIFLVCAWKTCSTNGVSLNDQEEQIIDRYIVNTSALEDKILQIETSNIQLQALQLKVRQQGEVQEALASKLIELNSKLQQQQLLFDVIQNKRQRPNCQSLVKDGNDHKSRINGEMPASCADLQVLGHNLNGFYSVMSVGKMESVYCDFTKVPNEPDFQLLIGFTEIKSESIAFYVQRSSSFTDVNTPIPFQVERLNVGGAMNLTSGIFTASATGDYFFSVSGTAYISSSIKRLVFTIGLYMNDNPIAYGYADEMSSEYQYETFSLQSTLHLIKDDQVWLQISSIESGVSLYGGLFTHFNGWLLHQDIFQSTSVR